MNQRCIAFAAMPCLRPKVRWLLFGRRRRWRAGMFWTDLAEVKTFPWQRVMITTPISKFTQCPRARFDVLIMCGDRGVTIGTGLSVRSPRDVAVMGFDVWYRRQPPLTAVRLPHGGPPHYGEKCERRKRESPLLMVTPLMLAVPECFPYLQHSFLRGRHRAGGSVFLAADVRCSLPLFRG